MEEFVGRPLIELLRAKMRREDLSLKQLARHLQVGQSYVSQLSCGAKPLSSVSDQFLRGCAEYLGMPVVLIYLLSGRLQSKDFFIPPTNMDLLVDCALEQIGRTTIAAETAIDFTILSRLPMAAKLLIVLLYERAESVLLIPRRVGRGEVEAMGQSSVPFEVRLNKPI